MKKLIFSIALNGYDRGYRSCLDTQRDYARRIGADFVVVKTPRVGEPALAAWLKVSLLAQILEGDYDWVAYIDADCRIAEGAPDFADTFKGSNESVFMAKGRSGRINSGVIFVRNDAASRSFFERVLASVTLEIPAKHRKNLKYENGNIIYIAEVHGGVGIMGVEWNNSFKPALDDHIRHFTGDMRALYKRPWRDSVTFKAVKLMAPRPKAAPAQRTDVFASNLEALSARVVRRYIDPKASV